MEEDLIFCNDEKGKKLDLELHQGTKLISAVK